MLSKTAEYALRVIASLAEAADQESADLLAEKTKVPRRYLQKVLQDLTAAGLLRSRSGPGGGYQLQQSPSEMTILDVINSVDPLQRIHHCPLGLVSHTSLCPLHAELDRAYAETEAAFSRVSIQEVLSSKGKIRPLCEVKSSQ